MVVCTNSDSTGERKKVEGSRYILEVELYLELGFRN